MDLSRIPLWVWIAGGGAVIGVAYLASRSSTSSTDTTGQSSGLSDALQSIMGSLGDLQGALQSGGGSSSSGSKGGGGGGSSSGNTTTGGVSGVTTRPTGIQGTPDQPPVRLNPPNPITGPGGLVQPFHQVTGQLSPAPITAGVRTTPLVKATTTRSVVTSTKPKAPSPIRSFVQPIYTRITAGRYTGKIVPLEYGLTSSKPFVPSNPVTGAGGLAQSLSPTTTKITSGQYAGKTVPL